MTENRLPRFRAATEGSDRRATDFSCGESFRFLDDERKCEASLYSIFFRNDDRGRAEPGIDSDAGIVILYLADGRTAARGTDDLDQSRQQQGGLYNGHRAGRDAMDHDHARLGRPAGRVERAGEPEWTADRNLRCKPSIFGNRIFWHAVDSRDTDGGTGASNAGAERDDIEFRHTTESSGNADADAGDHGRTGAFHRLGGKHGL